jgi:hypothetical protein
MKRANHVAVEMGATGRTLRKTAQVLKLPIRYENIDGSRHRVFDEKEVTTIRSYYEKLGSDYHNVSARERVDWERRCAVELEAQGYTTVVTKERGTPDVIAFKKRPEGGFDLVFREAKGPTDSIHKEQYEFVERMRALGVDAGFQWFV